MNQIETYVIYRHPREYPGHFVVRRWTTTTGNSTPAPDVQLAANLTDARRAVPQGLTRMGRFPGDDPVIVETWI